jgi:hypothetical protein
MDVADLGSVRAALADIDGSSGKPRQFGSPPGMARSLSRRPTANPMPRWLPPRKPRRRTVRGTPGVSRGSGRRIRPMGGSDSSGVANHAQAGRPSSERRSRPLGYSPVSRHPRRASPFTGPPCRRPTRGGTGHHSRTHRLAHNQASYRAPPIGITFAERLTVGLLGSNHLIQMASGVASLAQPSYDRIVELTATSV